MKTGVVTQAVRYRMTLLDLIIALQDGCRSDTELVAVITQLVNTGRVVLCGTFATRHIG
jgi:hypothetical protein